MSKRPNTPISTYCEDKLQSQIISSLRFPLAVGIVLLHTHLTDSSGVSFINHPEYPIFSHFSFFLSLVISGRIALPCFFFISGFLFFYRCSSFSVLQYKKKLQRRFHSLFIPYILWNLLIFLVYLLVAHFLPEMATGKYKMTEIDSLTDFLSIFWNVNGSGYPISGPLWFIRDLCLLSIASPLLYGLIRHLKGAFLLPATLYFLLGCPGLESVGNNEKFIFFYLVGAYISIHHYNFLHLAHISRLWTSLIFVLSVLVVMIWGDHDAFAVFAHLISCTGICCAVNLMAFLLTKCRFRNSPFLSSSTFFIFAYHYFVIQFLTRILVKAINPQSEGTLLGIYLFCPVFVILLGLGIYYLLKRFLPKTTALLTGGR